jgi:hypothetical protein
VSDVGSPESPEERGAGLPAPERGSSDVGSTESPGDAGESRRIERPLPVVAPSAFLRVKIGYPVCGRSKRGGRSACARSYRVSRL